MTSQYKTTYKMKLYKHVFQFSCVELNKFMPWFKLQAKKKTKLEIKLVGQCLFSKFNNREFLIRLNIRGKKAKKLMEHAPLLGNPQQSCFRQVICLTQVKPPLQTSFFKKIFIIIEFFALNPITFIPVYKIQLKF